MKFMISCAPVEAVKLIISSSGLNLFRLIPTIDPFRAIPLTRYVISSNISPPGMGKEHPWYDGSIEFIGINGYQIMIRRWDPT